MAFLGVLSFFQIVFLPGALLLSAADYRGPILRRILLSFGLSLTANYLGVFALTLAGLYIRPVVLAIFILEVLALAWFGRSAALRGTLTPTAPARVEAVIPEVRRRWLEGTQVAQVMKGIAAMAALLLALAAVGRVLITFGGNWGSIFTYVDAVLSWNRWALDWFHNSLPVVPYHYPQLLPANWSISYVMLGTPLQYVAKGLMPVFMIALLLTMIHLAWTARSAGPYVAALVTPILYARCRIDMTEGLADVAVSFMAFLAFGCLMWAQREPGLRARDRFLLLGAILAAAAAVTKQAGLYFLVMYPFLALGLVLHGEARPGIRDARRFVAFYLGVIVAVVVPFYLYAELQILRQLNASEVQYVTQGIFRGTPVPERMVNALELLRSHLGDKVLIVCSALSLVALAERLARWTVLLIVIPFGLLWAAFYSYDLRNLSVALPFLAMSAGTGAAILSRTVSVSLPVLQHGSRWLSKRNARLAAGIGVVAIASTAAFGLDLSSERLIARHEGMRRTVGNVALNERLYAQQRKQPFTGQIVTNYSYMGYIPELERWSVFDKLASREDFAQYWRYVRRFRVKYFLVSLDAFPPILRDVEERLQSGDFKELFRAEGYVLVEIVVRR